MSKDLFESDTSLMTQPAAVPAVIDAKPTQLTPTGQINQVTAVTNLIHFAIENKTDPAALEKLVDLQLKVMALDAKAQFDAAMKAFQTECPVIGKNRTADIKSRKGDDYGYRFADFEHVAETIKPLCDKYGFSYGFEQELAGSIVTIICEVSHSGGHSKKTKFSGSNDTNASMSAIQKSGAATTFGRRYALVLAFGLTIGEDNDGKRGPEHEAPEQNGDAPKVPARGEPVVTAEMMKKLCEGWKQYVGLDRFDAAKFAEWADKQCEHQPRLNPTTPKAWPSVLTKMQYDELMRAMP